MIDTHQLIHVTQPAVNLDFPWFAIKTKSNFERTTYTILKGKGYDPLLFTYRRERPGFDRVRVVDLPLFPGYLFCRFDVSNRLPILTTPGVVSIVGFGKEPVPIPDEEIDAVETVLRSGVKAESVPYVERGQRVKVSGGYFQGLQGILLQIKSQTRLVISLTLLQRSLAVEIDAHLVSAY